MPNNQRGLWTLNDYMFDELERLSNAKDALDIQKEVLRAEALSNMAESIIKNANTLIKVAEYNADRLDANDTTAQKLIGKRKEKGITDGSNA